MEYIAVLAGSLILVFVAACWVLGADAPHGGS
jgi:hypothetical protein